MVEVLFTDRKIITHIIVISHKLFHIIMYNTIHIYQWSLMGAFRSFEGGAVMF